MDPLTPEQRRRNMQAIKSRDTKAEILLSKTLWRLGYRYRKNSKYIFGKPDLVFSRYRIIVFVDSEFFHGYNWIEKKGKIKANRDYWIPKIERNIQRDKEVNEFLTANGWTVLRFWSKEIQKNLEDVIAVIQQKIEEAKSSNL